MGKRRKGESGPASARSDNSEVHDTSLELSMDAVSGGEPDTSAFFGTDGTGDTYSTALDVGVTSSLGSELQRVVKQDLPVAEAQRALANSLGDASPNAEQARAAHSAHIHQAVADADSARQAREEAQLVLERKVAALHQSNMRSPAAAEAYIRAQRQLAVFTESRSNSLATDAPTSVVKNIVPKIREQIHQLMQENAQLKHEVSQLHELSTIRMSPPHATSTPAMRESPARQLRFEEPAVSAASGVTGASAVATASGPPPAPSSSCIACCGLYSCFALIVALLSMLIMLSAASMQLERSPGLRPT